MSNYFERILKEIDPNQPPVLNQYAENLVGLMKKVEKLSKELKDLNSKGSSSRPVLIASKSSNKSSVSNDKPMTLEERVLLAQNIRALPLEYMRGVWEIVADSNPIPQNKDEHELDLHTLNSRKCRELERYVKNKLSQHQKLMSKKKSKGTSSAQKNPSTSVMQDGRLASTSFMEVLDCIIKKYYKFVSRISTIYQVL
jgi:hypothetical protein